ncbi:MAG TPA: class I adenylate-forming enzyme family protein [Polyangium sp.]|nr:class I adenylate-forming enzyme family protein [Polyangium sp.]
MEATSSASLIVSAGSSTVGQLFHNAAAAYPERIALNDGGTAFTYAELERRSNALANFFLASGIQPNDRIAVLCRNRHEYFELLLAASKVGAIVAALNWRLLGQELEHCVNLVSPKMVFAAQELVGALGRVNDADLPKIVIEERYERLVIENAGAYPDKRFDPETGLVILYTSGTTGLPKGALISHRAMVARGMLYNFLLNVPDQDNFVAWAPFYHMVSTDHGLATLMRGGTVWCADGYQPERLIWLVENLHITWFPVVPGMVGSFNEELKKRSVKPKGIKVIGAMADLIPRDEIAEATRLLNAPFLNTFGATETGLPPATGGLIPIGVAPEKLSKLQSPYCDLRLEDPDGNEVPTGVPGEAAVAGPTVFSGYWNNDKTNLSDFRGGRFHMGDVLRRNADGTLDYVDRVKYMIKSGGENIYPAEIELAITTDARIETAIVVKKKDPKWGEVPVVFIVSRDPSLTEEDVLALCKGTLASYKRPKEAIFIKEADIPRSTTGKIQRHLLEQKL